MTNINKYAKKIMAITLATLCFSLPLTEIASAHGKHDAPPPPPRQHDRYDRHDNHRNHESTVSKSSSNRKAATSFIIGAVLGAVIAKNT